MPPKKKEGGKKKGKAPDFTPEDVDAFVKSYKSFCVQAGLAVYEPLVRQLTDDEDRDEFMQNQQVGELTEQNRRRRSVCVDTQT